MFGAHAVDAEAARLRGGGRSFSISDVGFQLQVLLTILFRRDRDPLGLPIDAGNG
jgi:hypothetical protein